MEGKGKKAERELPERWSAQQKTEIVLRLLRGEDLGEVSREVQVLGHDIEEWRSWVRISRWPTLFIADSAVLVS